MSDLKYLMSYTIAIVTIVGILLGGGYTYMTVIYAFVFIPALEMLLKESNEFKSLHLLQTSIPPLNFKLDLQCALSVL